MIEEPHCAEVSQTFFSTGGSLSSQHFSSSWSLLSSQPCVHMVC